MSPAAVHTTFYYGREAVLVDFEHTRAIGIGSNKHQLTLCPRLFGFALECPVVRSPAKISRSATALEIAQSSAYPEFACARSIPLCKGIFIMCEFTFHRRCAPGALKSPAPVQAPYAMCSLYAELTKSSCAFRGALYGE